MTPPRVFYPAARRPEGVALVIVLSLVVLLSAIVFAFFSRAVLDRQTSSSSASVIKADVLARGALDEIVLDLKQEIVAGSTINEPPANTPNAGKLTLYLPKPGTASSISTIAPAMVPPPSPGNPNNPANVLKRSASGQAFFSGTNYAASFPPSNHASAVNSAANPSTDGRYVSAARWNKPQLLDAGKLGDASRQVAVYDDYFAAPDWVLVTRGGPKAFDRWPGDNKPKQEGDLANMDYVVGRYSYMVYDEGGLLDINQAGFPSSLLSDPGFIDFTARRGRLAQVDITQIPGVTNADSIVSAFRNARTGADAPSYKKYVLNNFPANPGFLRVVPGDQTFLGRQDLLNFQQQNASILDASALPYLGTFSRDINAPTWTPTVDAPAAGPFRYKTIADGPDGDFVPTNPDAVFDSRTVFNRNLATLRFSGASTIPASASGLIAERVVQSGEPVLRRRFPLSRLGWIGRNGPVAPATDPDVQRTFGLTFTSRGVWTYTSPDSTTRAKRIKTLNEVAKLSPPREPDFFELLQAGILHGSLGLSNAPNSDNAALRSNADTRDIDRSKSRQLMQIGANIIDQYDTDGWPTTILFDWFNDPELKPAMGSPYTPTSPSNYLSGPNGLYPGIVGTEDIPQLYKIYQTYYRHPALGAGGNLVGLFQFCELWNPHQSLRAPSGGPTVFRVRTETGNSVFSYGQSETTVCRTPFSYDAIPQEIITTATAAEQFRNPKILDSTNSISPTARTGVPWGPVTGNVWLIPGGAHNAFDNQYRCPWLFNSSRPGPTYRLDFQNEDGSWSTYPYQMFPEFCYYYDDKGSGGADSNQWYGAYAQGAGRPDPRGVRWGFSQAGGNWKFNARINPTDGSYFGRPSYKGAGGASNDLGALYTNGNVNDAEIYPNRGLSGDYNKPFNDWTNFSNGGPDAAMGRFSNNQPGYSRYTDIDGVTRAGDAYLGVPAANPEPPSPMDAGQLESRPIILNRPFQTVGELSYVFRDQPWRTLDFFSADSADAALLDIFTVNDSDIKAGVVDLNTRQAPVLKAILSGSMKKQYNSTPLASGESEDLATGLTNLTTAQTTPDTKGSLLNVGELSTRYLPSITNNNTSPRIKNQREAAVRTLAETGTTRVWNLMIDVIAQTGRYSSGATRLEQFNVAGEKRYWLHVAIDRYTGQVIDQNLESVTE